MKCILMIPASGISTQVALVTRNTIKELDPRAKVLFYSVDFPGFFRNRNLPEISDKYTPGKQGRSFFTRLFRLHRMLSHRKGYREQLVLFQENVRLLPWIFFFTRKKPVLVHVVVTLNKNLSFWETLLCRLFSRPVLLNDRLLCTTLRRHNVPTYFTGNLPADVLRPVALTFLPGSKTTLAFIPREKAFSEDIDAFLDLVLQLDKDGDMYYLLALPRGADIDSALPQLEKRGWFFRHSLEGDIIDGYLWNGSSYVNLTRFLAEAMEQADRVLSTDELRVLQATGLGKRSVFLSPGDTGSAVTLLNNNGLLLEHHRNYIHRFGKRGAVQKLAGYLLTGVVEESYPPLTSHHLREAEARKAD